MKAWLGSIGQFIHVQRVSRKFQCATCVQYGMVYGTSVRATDQLISP